MNTLRKILVMVVLSILLFSIVGCAVHAGAQASMGAGTGTKYAAAMSARRGSGIDFPADAGSISKESKSNITRAARD